MRQAELNQVQEFRPWDLVFSCWSFCGAWSLEFGAFPVGASLKLGVWKLELVAFALSFSQTEMRPGAATIQFTWSRLKLDFCEKIRPEETWP
jgi:hypothetical protein